MAICATAYGRQCDAASPHAFTYDLYRFGEIPVVSEGRTKPLDSAARADLLAISGRTEIVEESEPKLTFMDKLQESG